MLEIEIVEADACWPNRVRSIAMPNGDKSIEVLTPVREMKTRTFSRLDSRIKRM